MDGEPMTAMIGGLLEVLLQSVLRSTGEVPKLWGGPVVIGGTADPVPAPEAR